MESSQHARLVTPIRPAAPYIGGKRQLSARLVDLIESVPHATYAEPFVGMGGVFLRRRRVPSGEVINDISGDVAGFFRILQRHYVAFMDMLRFQLSGRREFERLLAVDPSTLTDLERAARFLYLQRLSYGGKVAGRTFGVQLASPARFDVTKLAPMLADINDRLAGVVIENLPYTEFIERYDSAGTLFYLDPPYFNSEKDYGQGVFARSDFHKLAKILSDIQGSFVLSINDVPEVRHIFSGFHQEVVDLTYTVRGGEGKAVTELIITPPGMRRVEREPELFG